MRRLGWQRFDFLGNCSCVALPPAYMDPSRLQDKLSMPSNEVIAPIYPACWWNALCFLALMDICAHSPHHPYGLARPMQEPGFERAGLTDLHIKTTYLRNRGNGFSSLAYSLIQRYQHALHRRLVTFSSGKNDPSHSRHFVGHRNTSTIVSAAYMQRVGPAAESIVLGGSIA